VVWAELEDANGHRKVRPAVVVTATADIVAGQPVGLPKPPSGAGARRCCLKREAG
jgi:hypothetical protein